MKKIYHAKKIGQSSEACRCRVYYQRGLPRLVFTELALWADSVYKSICPSVCVFVRLCVCSVLRYRLTVFWPPLPEVGCPIFLEIQNSWGKVMERSGLIFEHFCLKIVKNRSAKKNIFLMILRACFSEAVI